ncbi:hypothetical protein AMELA_G00257860 [Ameiurus melas]|uniref:Adenylate cyclase type 10 n=1 Tax=Ameiurus melas TaxID=219545 RepID=A0A7J5ZTU8_AMEME|nr:hypothetical protein AMELA_G00257860 [Ameiurus melas]
MDFNVDRILNLGLSRSELYRVLSSEGIRAAEVKTGVLLYLCIKEYTTPLPETRSAILAACIHAAGGYVLHHTGDAILAEWVEENVQMSDTKSHVARCLFTILKVYMIELISYLDMQPIKIALSVGEFTKIRLGAEENQVCAVIGPAVEEIRSAQALLEHGVIVLCPEAWRLCNRQNLTVENIKNKEIVKLRQLQWRMHQEIISVDYPYCYKTHIHMTRTEQRKMSVHDLIFSWRHSIRIHKKKNPITYLLTNKERETFIHEFMIQTAQDKIHENRQREAANPGLSEIWPTTIMFVYLQFVLTRTDLRFGHQEVSETIAEQMFRCRGKICNVFFSEDGCIFVCAVGLPGDTRPDKTTRALKAAVWIHETCCKQIDSVSSVSIGVATGRVKYQFEKSPLRECCRVYGEKVHKAAELSRNNPGIVSCDELTKHYSLLPLSIFQSPTCFSLEFGQVYSRDYPMRDLEHEFSPGKMNSRRLAFANMQTMLAEEQKVVKCASVIGHFNNNNFNFELLKDTLPGMNEQELIILLRSLFRAGIFKCASEPRKVLSTKTCYCKNSCEGKRL